MHLFQPALVNKSLCVIGTWMPWIEAIGVDVGCSKVVTLDYTRSLYEFPNMEWFHVNDYLDQVISSQKLEHFDAIASYSSIEHSGLGRYGDPLNPNGDIEAMRQMHCMIKPGGLLFLGLPTNDDGSSYMEFNAQRVYGKARLEHLFKGWKFLMRTKKPGDLTSLFVLQKV